jgi:enoyl-CoA hydratase
MPAVPDGLRVEREGAVSILTVARPETRNALSFAVMGALTAALHEATRDRRLRALVITGEGKAFVSGGDLRELRVAGTSADAERLCAAGRGVCEAIERLDVPVIAAINGAAIGGGVELAVACDLRIADERAKLCFKHVRMGLVTSWGTFPRLLQLVGASTAARLLFTAHDVRATEARSLGLVDQVTESGASVATALAWAEDIAQGSPSAVANMKGLFRDSRAANVELAAREQARFVASWTSDDHRDAVEAFFESRAPKWRER